MSLTIPDSHLDLLTDPIVVTLSTILPDGQPQVTAVWCLLHEGEIVVTTSIEARKAQNALANPKVTIFALDPTDGGRFVEVRGTASIQHDDIVATRQKIFDKYAFKGTFPLHDRVLIRITPTRVRVSGGGE